MEGSLTLELGQITRPSNLSCERIIELCHLINYVQDVVSKYTTHNA
jgi:hypothetical protein